MDVKVQCIAVAGAVLLWLVTLALAFLCGFSIGFEDALGLI